MRRSDSIIDYAIRALSFGMVFYHLLATQTLLFGPNLHYNTHMMFGFLLVFLGLAKAEPRWRGLWLFGVLLSLIAFGYVYLLHDELVDRSFFNTDLDLVIGALMIALALLAIWKGRRGLPASRSKEAQSSMGFNKFAISF